MPGRTVEGPTRNHHSLLLVYPRDTTIQGISVVFLCLLRKKREFIYVVYMKYGIKNCAFIKAARFCIRSNSSYLLRVLESKQ